MGSGWPGDAVFLSSGNNDLESPGGAMGKGTGQSLGTDLGYLGFCGRGLPL